MPPSTKISVSVNLNSLIFRYREVVTWAGMLHTIVVRHESAESWWLCLYFPSPHKKHWRITMSPEMSCQDTSKARQPARSHTVCRHCTLSRDLKLGAAFHRWPVEVDIQNILSAELDLLQLPALQHLHMTCEHVPKKLESSSLTCLTFEKRRSLAKSMDCQETFLDLDLPHLSKLVVQYLAHTPPKRVCLLDISSTSS